MASTTGMALLRVRGISSLNAGSMLISRSCNDESSGLGVALVPDDPENKQLELAERELCGWGWGPEPSSTTLGEDGRDRCKCPIAASEGFGRDPQGIGSLRYEVSMRLFELVR